MDIEILICVAITYLVCSTLNVFVILPLLSRMAKGEWVPDDNDTAASVIMSPIVFLLAALGIVIYVIVKQFIYVKGATEKLAILPDKVRSMMNRVNGYDS